MSAIIHYMVLVVVATAQLVHSHNHGRCSDDNLMFTDALATCLGAVKDAMSPTTLVPSSADLTVYIRASVSAGDASLQAEDICCRSIGYPQYDNVTVNPLEDKTYGPHIFRATPTFEFYVDDTDTAAVDDDNLYTLAMFDITTQQIEDVTIASTDRPMLHWLQTNVRGLTEYTSSTEALPYYSPDRQATYVIVVYQQAGEVDMTTDTYVGEVTGEACPARRLCMFDISAMISEHSLTLVGATMLRTAADAVYASYLALTVLEQSAGTVCMDYTDITMGGDGSPVCNVSADVCDEDNLTTDADIQTCLNAVKLAANRWAPNVVPSTVELETFLIVSRTQEEFVIGSFCCEDDRKMPAVSETINPLEGKRIQPYVFREQPDFNITSKSDGPTEGDDNLYTLIFFDVTVDDFTGNELSLPGFPYLHWMKNNIQGLDMSTGNVARRYAGPTLTNKYTIGLYKQEEQVTIDPTQYDGAEEYCADIVLCRFDLNRVVSEYNLQLIGITWFWPDNNEVYLVNFLMTILDQSEVEACNALSGFTVRTKGTSQLDCLPVSAGIMPTAAGVVIVVNVLLSLYL